MLRREIMNLNDIKIVTDSSADMLSLEKVNFTSAPLKIITSEKEYVDDENIDVDAFIDDLDKNKDKVTTACPSSQDWLNAFGDAKCVFCITITSNLSGAYNSAVVAKKEYEEKNAGSRVHIFDSLSTGPECKLIAEKIQELAMDGKSMDEIIEIVENYMKKTHLMFMLESVKNLKNNGRVSPILAKIIGVLGIRLVGKASDQGTLEVLSKVRGEKHALSNLVDHIKKLGYNGGKLRIAHCRNVEVANKLKDKLKELFADADIEIYPTRALCSFYAEKGGLLVGFEG